MQREYALGLAEDGGHLARVYGRLLDREELAWIPLLARYPSRGRSIPE